MSRSPKAGVRIRISRPERKGVRPSLGGDPGSYGSAGPGGFGMAGLVVFAGATEGTP